ncbi:excalibur calcium-binding domain-containing protein [Streptomyces justiciae]|uniref:excalibur calcium-binding domain-containing protein n=1 Tax=Streptomyces justiciae TaxID=2780140 RepID=UPI002119880C|nr:excalibur calcium-binding domain-containing protein [Streptomyces justiciae]MCW8381284.1 excalibur calcium-binding domain-containing protein [Streptomyces justiciae]
MKLLRKPGALVVAALALAVLPSAASAHDGDHPFDNCTDAYAAGYANIEKGDEHYGTHLDRDGDGIGCDQPPADFVAADDKAAGTETEQKADGKQTASDDLAETGGDDTTPYLAAGSVVALVAGSGVLLAARRRRAPADRP